MPDIDYALLSNRKYLDQLLASPFFRFDDKLHSSIPEKPGIYRIFLKSSGETIRAGSTVKSDSLLQRIYQNHLMGNQQGNIRAQLIKSGLCDDLSDAKTYLKENCMVQWLVIENPNDRKWAEHFMLSVLRPRFSD